MKPCVREKSLPVQCRHAWNVKFINSDVKAFKEIYVHWPKSDQVHLVQKMRKEIGHPYISEAKALH